MYLPSSVPVYNKQPIMNNTNVFSVPADLCHDATRASQISLLIRACNPRKKNLRAITCFFPRLWGLDNVVSGRVVDNGRAQFLFPTNEALQLVLRRGPWSFNEWMVVMEPWVPNLSEQSPTTLDFWIQIRDIPIQYLSIQMLNFIAEMLGHVIETDEAGFGGSSISGRVLIRWQIDRPLVFERAFQFGFESVTISFRYEKLRNYCFRCHSLQHGIEECEIPEDDAAMGHQEPDDEDGINQDVLVYRKQRRNPPPLQATPIRAISSSGDTLALPSSSREPTDMASASVLVDGRRMLVSEIQNFYHTYKDVDDPTEAEARRRRVLLSLEHVGNSIIHEITRPLISEECYPKKCCMT